MGNLTYQQRGNQSTKIPVSQRRTEGGRVLEDNRAAFSVKQLKLGETAQRVEKEDELLKGKSRTTQLAQKDEEGETDQTKFSVQVPLVQREDQPAKPNNTGLPDNLKNGIEALSGLSMDNVKVHYNSAKPQQLNALAYAQGTDIHVGAGQDKHLPHEAWHMVQQAQGRVKPTMQMKGGMSINDDGGLEREADVMGEKAAAGVVQAIGQKARPTPVAPKKEIVHAGETAQLGGGTSKPASQQKKSLELSRIIGQICSKDPTEENLLLWQNQLRNEIGVEFQFLSKKDQDYARGSFETIRNTLERIRDQKESGERKERARATSEKLKEMRLAGPLPQEGALDIIRDYTSPDTGKAETYFNTPIRSKTMKEDEQKHILNLQQALMMSPVAQEQELWRGAKEMLIGGIRPSEIQLNEKYCEPAFLSTSKKRSVSSGFGRFMIKIIKHSTGRDIISLGGDEYGGGEEEVLFPAGSEFLYLGQDDEGNFIYEEV